MGKDTIEKLEEAISIVLSSIEYGIVGVEKTALFTVANNFSVGLPFVVHLKENLSSSGEKSVSTTLSAITAAGVSTFVEIGTFTSFETAITAATFEAIALSGGTATVQALSLWGSGTIANLKFSSEVGSAANKLIFNSLEYGPTVISIATAMFKASQGDSAYSQFFNQTPEGTLNTRIITITDDNQTEVQAELRGDSGKQVLHLQNIDGAEKEFVFEQKSSIEQILQNVKGTVYVTTDGTITSSTPQLVDDYRAERTIDNVFLVGEDDYVSVKELDVLVSLKDYTKVVSQFPGGGIDTSAMAPLSMFSNIATDMHIDMQNLMALRGNEYLQDRIVNTISDQKIIVMTPTDAVNISPISSSTYYELTNFSSADYTLKIDLGSSVVTERQAVDAIDPWSLNLRDVSITKGLNTTDYNLTDGSVIDLVRDCFDGQGTISLSGLITTTDAAGKVHQIIPKENTVVVNTPQGTTTLTSQNFFQFMDNEATAFFNFTQEIMFFKLNNSNFILLGEQNNGERLFENKSEWWAEKVA